jgi:hypothetical protein
MPRSAGAGRRAARDKIGSSEGRVHPHDPLVDADGRIPLIPSVAGYELRVSSPCRNNPDIPAGLRSGKAAGIVDSGQVSELVAVRDEAVVTRDNGKRCDITPIRSAATELGNEGLDVLRSQPCPNDRTSRVAGVDEVLVLIPIHVAVGDRRGRQEGGSAGGIGSRLARSDVLHPDLVRPLTVRRVPVGHPSAGDVGTKLVTRRVCKVDRLCSHTPHPNIG